MGNQLEPRVFKTVAEKKDEHWHVSVFSAKAQDQTYALLGVLVMDAHDYSHFAINFESGVTHQFKFGSVVVGVDEAVNG